MSILERIARWYEHGTAKRAAQGEQLECILIHPSDAAAAPAEYMGLPVVSMPS